MYACVVRSRYLRLDATHGEALQDDIKGVEETILISLLMGKGGGEGGRGGSCTQLPPPRTLPPGPVDPGKKDNL